MFPDAMRAQILGAPLRLELEAFANSLEKIASRTQSLFAGSTIKPNKALVLADGADPARAVTYSAQSGPRSVLGEPWQAGARHAATLTGIQSAELAPRLLDDNRVLARATVEGMWPLAAVPRPESEVLRDVSSLLAFARTRLQHADSRYEGIGDAVTTEAANVQHASAALELARAHVRTLEDDRAPWIAQQIDELAGSVERSAAAHAADAAEVRRHRGGMNHDRFNERFNASGAIDRIAKDIDTFVSSHGIGGGAPRLSDAERVAIEASAKQELGVGRDLVVEDRVAQMQRQQAEYAERRKLELGLA
jgi:hypothetical protein